MEVMPATMKILKRVTTLIMQKKEHQGQGRGKDKKNSQQKAGSSKKKVVREKKQQKKRKTSDNQDVDDTTKAMPRRKKHKADNVGEVKRKSERNHAPSIHTQWPYTAEKKRHPIVHPFEKVNTTRVELLAKWKSSRKTKPLTILGNKVDAKWFTTLETPGKSITAAHIDPAVQLYKQRKESHPDIYVNKDVTLVDSKFIQAIDDSYAIFLDDKDGFDFEDECFSKVFKEKHTKVTFAPMCVEQRLWIPLEINLASRSIHIWDNASSFFSDKKKKKQVEAYARSMPYILHRRNFQW
ncbi:uncharacterized protein LOC111832665 [Capsella rubella]|uniref:uncharacterized protein LOC111832665 n=1 Tax=Capsella rubella TaxID=81985 RepID=UPI000CD4F8AC|nr:uncharacterized protein LOC111832665 [Capsella rubella]